VKAGLGGYICVNRLDNGSLGGLGGRRGGVVVAMLRVQFNGWKVRKLTGMMEWFEGGEATTAVTLSPVVTRD
jgi:hypothetical protein